MMKNIFKKGVQDAARKFGFVRPLDMPFDLTEINAHPLELIRAIPQFPLLLNIDLALIFDFPPLVLPCASNPFVKTAQKILNAQEDDLSRAFLFDYYQRAPKTVVDMLFAADDHSMFGNAATLDPIQVELPWRGVSGPDVEMRRRQVAKRHAVQYGVDPEKHDHPYTFGPVSEQKIELEHTRIDVTLKSIQSRGYQPESIYENIRASVLLDEVNTNCAVIVQKGTHRVAALVALGYKSIPVLVYPRDIVRLSTAPEWPGVVSGDFTLNSAISLFNRILSGRAPSFINDCHPALVPADRLK